VEKTLFIDLDKVMKDWKTLDIQCSYPYHFKNNGIVSLREWLTFQIICRKCEEMIVCVSPVNPVQLPALLEQFIWRFYLFWVFTVICVKED